jgi:hypothetical protein
LPNQLQAVLDQMVEIEPLCTKSTDIEQIMDLVNLQSVSLQKDVKRYLDERSD